MTGRPEKWMGTISTRVSAMVWPVRLAMIRPHIDPLSGQGIRKSRTSSASSLTTMVSLPVWEGPNRV